LIGGAKIRESLQCCSAARRAARKTVRGVKLRSNPLIGMGVLEEFPSETGSGAYLSGLAAPEAALARARR